MTLIVSYTLSGNVRSVGLTTLFQYSEENKSFYLNSEFDFLKEKTIGLIINHTSKIPMNETRDYSLDSSMSTLELFENNNLNVVKIFSPEHGFKGNFAAGEEVPSTSKIVSLYGSNKSPKNEDLEGIDVLIFDIQDIGARYYTYLSTMQLCMEKAAEKNISFIVLDRPNPLGRKLEGAILDLNFKSFVGMNPVPVRHGMTAGEMALFIKQNNLIKEANQLPLQVISGSNWDPDYSSGGRCKAGFEQTSPNIPTLEHALIYIGTCLLEGTNISEGRGTDNPFKVFGAPWLDSEAIIKALNKYSFNDVNFIKKNFTPNSSKYKREKCNGVQIEFSNLDIDAFKIGVAIINEIYKIHPDNFEFKDNFFDKLYGSDALRLAISNGESLDELFEKIDIQNEDFSKKMVTIY